MNRLLNTNAHGTRKSTAGFNGHQGLASLQEEAVMMKRARFVRTEDVERQRGHGVPRNVPRGAVRRGAWHHYRLHRVTKETTEEESLRREAPARARSGQHLCCAETPSTFRRPTKASELSPSCEPRETFLISSDVSSHRLLLVASNVASLPVQENHVISSCRSCP